MASVTNENAANPADEPIRAVLTLALTAYTEEHARFLGRLRGCLRGEGVDWDQLAELADAGRRGEKKRRKENHDG